MSETDRGVVVGEGYAVGHLDAIGEGYGFRKVRKVLDVTAFGVNALVRPAGYETKWHYPDLQEELYFVHRGSIEMEFADGANTDWMRAPLRAWMPPPRAKSVSSARTRRFTCV